MHIDTHTSLKIKNFKDFLEISLHVKLIIFNEITLQSDYINLSAAS